VPCFLPVNIFLLVLIPESRPLEAALLFALLATGLISGVFETIPANGSNNLRPESPFAGATLAAGDRQRLLYKNLDRVPYIEILVDSILVES